MPDPTVVPATPPTPTDQTSPLDAGHTTTEYAATKWIIVITTILGVLSGIVPLIEQAKAIFGDTKWITIASIVVGGLTTVLYTLQRSVIKIAAIKAGQSAVPTGTADDAAAKLGT